MIYFLFCHIMIIIIIIISTIIIIIIWLFNLSL